MMDFDFNVDRDTFYALALLGAAAGVGGVIGFVLGALIF